MQPQLSDLLHRIINRVREGHKIEDIKSIGIDEVSYAKGRKFIYDLDKSRVVWVGKGKGRDTLYLGGCQNSFFTEA